LLRFVFHVALPSVHLRSHGGGGRTRRRRHAGQTRRRWLPFRFKRIGAADVFHLRVHVYVAGLYLERRTPDPNAIVGSSQPKLPRFVFLRDVDAEDARKSWREALDRNCPAPCSLTADGNHSQPTLQTGDSFHFYRTESTSEEVKAGLLGVRGAER
jgi:hypothetical protein